MIDRALQLKDAIELYISHFRHDKDHPTAEDDLLPNEWRELCELRDLLRPMKLASVNIQNNPKDGGQGALWSNLSAIDSLMTHLERSKQSLSTENSSHFKACVNLGWKKLNKYYRLSERTSAYRAAIFFNPRYRLQ